MLWCSAGLPGNHATAPALRFCSAFENRWSIDRSAQLKFTGAQSQADVPQCVRVINS